MDHTDGAADEYHTYSDVAQKLIETLNGILHPECDVAEPQQQQQHVGAVAATAAAASPADLEIILDMILANLTFDDPGIFFAGPTPHRRARRMQLDFNRWLHHQIVYIVVRFPSDSLRRKAAELQHEMLAASLLKQRWLFRLTVDRYAQLLRDLCDAVDWTRLPHTVWPSTATDADVDADADIAAAAPNHSRIQIDTVAVRDQLAGHCIALLTHAAALYCNTDAALLQRSADSVMAAYRTLGLAGKTLALQFFAKVMRRLVVPVGDVDSLLHRNVPKLLQGIQQIRGQLPVWMQSAGSGVRAKDVKRFVETLGYMLGIRELAGFCTGAYNYAVCVEMCTFLLGAPVADGHQPTDDACAAELAAHFGGKFLMTVLEFFGRVLQLNRVQFGRDVWPLFAAGQSGRREPDMVGLLQNCVRDQMIADSSGDGLAVWRLVDELVAEAFGASEAGTSMNEQCRRINTLATMLLTAEHAFQLWHQEHHLRHAHPSELHTTCVTCQSPELADDWERIQFFQFSHQLRQTHRRLRATMQTLCGRFVTDVLLVEPVQPTTPTADGLFELCDTAWRLFGNRHARTLDECQQQQLLAAAMCTLLPATGDHLPDDQPAQLRRLLLTVPPIADGERQQFHEHLLHTVRSTNMHGLPKALRTQLADWCGAIGSDRLPASGRYDLWQHLLLQAELPLNDVLAATVDRLSTADAPAASLCARLLRVLVCTAGGRSYSATANETLESQLCCVHCDADAATGSDADDAVAAQTAPPVVGDCGRGLIHRNRFNEWSNGAALKTLLRAWLPQLFAAGATLQCRLDAVDCLPAVAVHFCDELVRESPAWLPVCADPVAEVQLRLAAVLPAVLANVRRSQTLTARDKRTFFERLFAQLGAAVEASLTPVADAGGRSRAERQAGVVAVLQAVATHAGAAEVTLLQAFVLTLWFLVRVESEVAKTAALAAFEMCARSGTTVHLLVAWHRERVFQLLCGAAVANWLQHGLGLHRTLSNFCHLLGYQNRHSTFIPNYSDTLLALLLPWRQRQPACEPLLEELCSAQSRSRPQVMASGFLQAYPYVCLRVEGPELRERCVEYLFASSGHGLVWHLKANSLNTLNEILIWYHRDPEFVMQTLRQLLAPTDAATVTAANSAIQQQQPLSVIADYIAARFLGVLNHFGIVLVATDLEKSLQAEVLLSLGDIIRFMGAAHITPFRFKILTMLRSVMAVERRPRLRNICAAVWKIFVYTVDVQAMGPLLSICVVYMEPLMDTHAGCVNAILKYLIIENGSLLSRHLNDLFFIERTRASAEIKEFVARHAMRDTVAFDGRFRLLAGQTGHENIEVRVYALQYLCELFEGEPAALNAMIAGGQPAMSPQVGELLASLLVGVRLADGQLQLAAGRCLGRVGALEPSHLPPNYAPQRKLALGIHTDVFATMALAELCRAYQFQKDTKRVDGFSLAIQEILLARGVNPEQNKKLNVWTAIPERMRQLMMPLLRSCYTALPTHVKNTDHPIFSAGRFGSAEKWACAWAGRLTEFVEDGDTKHLLMSFKTSLRNDAGVLSTFMPYILLHAVQTCTPANARCIEEELHCVFRHVLTSSEEPADGAGGSGGGGSGGSDDLAAKCARIAFALLEFLGSWLRQFQVVYANAKDDAYGRVAALLGCFDARVVAAANFRCGEYARALQYLEVYVAEDGGGGGGSGGSGGVRLQEELSFLAQIYAELLDSDSLAGALKMKAQRPTLAEQVLLHTATGRLQESTVCFEKMMQLGGMPERAAVDMVQCYLGLDQPETALMVADALMRQMYDRNVPSAMYACSAEPLWRLGRFEELDELVRTAKLREAPDWGIRCGQVLLAMRTGGMAEFAAEIDRCQLSVLRELRSHDGDELGSYDKVYPLVLRLHQIAEMTMCRATVEEVARTAAAAGSGETAAAVQTLTGLFEEWDARLELLQPTAKILEPVLCLRRILLNETNTLISRRIADERPTIAATCANLIHTYIGTSLMRSTELARTADMYHQSQLFILNAESHSPPTLFIEKAKLAWCKGDQAAALSTLERGIEELRPELIATAAPGTADATAGHRVFAEAKFLVATYNADAKNTNTTLNIKYFKEAMQAAGDSEKCYVFYAQYLEKVLAALGAAELAGARGNDSQLEIMTCYGKSMSYGCRYIYQSMPRFLSIWLDFTARAAPPVATDAGDSQRRIAQNMTKVVEHFADVLPSFVFFTAFSQLVSRICHPSADVYQVLKTIIIKLIKSFTQQSMWMIMSVYKSSYASRVKRCTEMFSDRRLAGRDIQKLIGDFNLLAERMIELTNRPVATGEKLTVATFYRELPALLRSPGFSPIVLPINQYMQPVLPAVEQRDRPAGEFNAFPSRAVYIADCQNELVVMPSLQKPKRITLIGDDGRDYMIMMKPKDDLRKDFRLMEFNAIVNRCLRQDAEARQRRLKIRTYAVLPLNEECGIIEWLPNLQALRPIVMELLKLKQLGVSSRELRELYRPVRDAAGKRSLLTTVLIPRHPPQLAEWYKERFSTAHNWYLARSSFVRTTAVISMAGYILGLGDRHGENILFDQSNGDTVHVDFNCLFNKGECFEVPELVPFRLTHNMVHAMGPLGVEGAYRQCSQITLRVLREQLATLMSVLRPFVYDPLVSWNRVMSKSDGRQERTDTQAITNVKRIEERLRGCVKQNGVVGTMALSCEGVVNHCIAEATDVDKLAAMYMGWGPFI